MPLSAHIRGYTLIEMLVVLATVGLLTGIMFASFTNIREKKTLDAEVAHVASLIEQARSQTLASKEASQYGIRFDSATVKLFKGTTFATSSVQNTITIGSNVVISHINLSSGGTDIVFERFTGKALTSGTTTFARGSSTKSIIIYGTGVIDIQ